LALIGQDGTIAPETPNYVMYARSQFCASRSLSGSAASRIGLPEFGQVMTLAEQQPVVEIASGEPLAKAWLIHNKGELIGYFILSLTFSLRSGRGAVLDQIYLTPELRTHRVVCRAIEFAEYQAALVGASMLDLKFTFKGRREPVAFERIGFQKGHSFMSKKLEPRPTYYRRTRLSE
jgi:hypothetical protein